jgi:hypothetical protein
MEILVQPIFMGELTTPIQNIFVQVVHDPNAAHTWTAISHSWISIKPNTPIVI